jgi:glycosyltransferase involved in cell wall biosynthesis
MSSGLISIIMPVYNAEIYLRTAIDSVLNQTYSNFEFIILNDASTDNSADVIKSYTDARIKYFEYSENEGYVVRLNQGIDYSKGEFVARMDSDDICSPNRLLKQVSFLSQRSEVVLCGTYFKLISSTGKEIGSGKRYSSCNLIKFKLLFSNPICHPSVMFRRNVLEEVGLYDPLKKPAEDYDLWTRIIKHHQIENLPEYLFYYRVHTSSVSHLHGSEQRKKAFSSGINYFTNWIGFDVSPAHYDFFLFRDHLYTYSANDLLAIENILNKIAQITINSNFEKSERSLVKEELSVYYFLLWTKRLHRIGIIFKSLSLLFSTKPFDKESICFKESSQVFLSTRRIFKSVCFGLIALFKNPGDKYNYYLVINPIKAIFR